MGGLECAPLSAFGKHDVAAAGGKGANLGELVRAGFPVPVGFVITTAAYRSATAGLERTPEAIRAAPISTDLAALIEAAYCALGQGPVAVRSSATAEDLPGAAFAGQHETFLNLTGLSRILEGIRDCWASLWSERAAAYRERLGVDPESVAIAVVVQRLVPADQAGVMLTAHPVTGDRTQVVIESSPGLGEAVVAGQVTPEHVIVSAKGAVVERRAGSAEYALGPAPGGGLLRSATWDLPTLSDAVLARLARVGRRIAAHFGSPQDVEWAIRGGVVSILQSRPMTALPPPVRRLSRAPRGYGSVFVEMLPRRPLPMELTTWILPMVAPMVRDMYGGILGVRLDIEEALRAEDAVVLEFVPPPTRPTVATPMRLAGIATKLFRSPRLDWPRDGCYLAFRRGLAEVSRFDPAAAGWPRLVAEHERMAALTRLLTEVRIRTLPAAAADMIRLAGALTVLGSGRQTAALLTGAASDTIRANDGLASLAALARGDRRLADAFGRLDGAALVEFVRSDAAARDLSAALGEFLSRYGHRETTSVLLPADPTWGEAPATVLELVRLLVSEPPRAGSSVRDAALAQVGAHPLVQHLHLLPAIRRWSTAAAAGYAVREDTHFEVSRLLPPLRALVDEVGRRLARARLIDARTDVWYLTWPEVAVIAEPDASAVHLRGAVARRRRRLAALTGSPLVNSLSLHPPRHRPDALCLGIGGGGGRAAGPVRVVRSVADFGRLRAGDVLVCPATNPSWTPLFRRAAAVVVDHGGPASHAAIVAREYGLPAVMGAGNATSVLVDGQRVLVDGDAGIVLADA